MASIRLPLLSRCRSTLVGYIADEELRGSPPFQRYIFALLADLLRNNNRPRYREEELLYVLRKLLNLQLWPGALWAAPSPSPSQYAAQQPCVYSSPLLDSRSHLTSKHHLIQRASSPTLSDGHLKHTYSTSITFSGGLPRSLARRHPPGFHHRRGIPSLAAKVVLFRKNGRKRRTSSSSMLVPSPESAWKQSVRRWVCPDDRITLFTFGFMDIYLHCFVLRFACIERYFSVPWEPGSYALSGIASPVVSGISRSRLRLGTYAVLTVAEVPFRESAPARARTRDIAVTLGDGVIVKEEIGGAMGVAHGRGQGERPW